MDKGNLEVDVGLKANSSPTLMPSTKLGGSCSSVWSLLLEGPTDFLGPFSYYFSISWGENGLSTMFQPMYAIAPAI